MPHLLDPDARARLACRLDQLADALAEVSAELAAVEPRWPWKYADRARRAAEAATRALDRL
jgi:hypothetical protein